MRGGQGPGHRGPTVDSISSAFAADKRFQVTTPTPVTIGPYSGKTFDLQLASTWTGTCPWSNGKPGAMVLTVTGGPTPTSPSYGIATGDPPLRIYLLDIGGSLVWNPGRQVNCRPGPAGPPDLHVRPVSGKSERGSLLEVPALRLFALDGFEQRLEVADAEAARAVALDDLEEERRAVLDGAA